MNKVELWNVYKALCNSNNILQSDRTYDLKKISDLPEGAISQGYYEKQYEIKFEWHTKQDKRKLNCVLRCRNHFDELGQMLIIDRN